MTIDKKTHKILMEEAALWHARLDSGSADISEFEKWRLSDPRHAAAFARIIGLASKIDQSKHAYPLERKALLSVMQSRRDLFLRFGFLTAAGLASIVFLPTIARARISTKIGERKHLSPAKGLEIEINTNSSAAYEVGDKNKVWLEHGELMLRVLDTSNSCNLFSGNSKITVLKGTLNARLRGKALDLMVVDEECFVLVDKPVQSNGPHDQNKPLHLQPNHALILTDKFLQVRPLDELDVKFKLGWRKQEIFLDGQTLGSAVEEYNRYLPHQIIIADPSLEHIRLGGRFDNRDPRDFLLALHDVFGIEAVKDKDDTVILTKKSQIS